MNTYAPEKELVCNPNFQNQRTDALLALDLRTIDAPIRDLVKHFNQLPYSFTLQSCYGHFLCPGQELPHNLEPLPAEVPAARVKYRIAYLAFCVQNEAPGLRLLEDARKIIRLDKENIQFGCAEWFWRRQPNSYILQVEPDRFKARDRVRLDLAEARHVEQTRNTFFQSMERLIQEHLRSAGT